MRSGYFWSASAIIVFFGYAREFQRNPKYGGNSFIDGSSFQSIADLMEANSNLRRLLFEQLNVTEIAIRAKLAHEYGSPYDCAAHYLDADGYGGDRAPTVDRPASIVKRILSDLDRAKSRMVGRYANSTVIGDDFTSQCKRLLNVPMWAARDPLIRTYLQYDFVYQRHRSSQIRNHLFLTAMRSLLRESTIRTLNEASP